MEVLSPRHQPAQSVTGPGGKNVSGGLCHSIVTFKLNYSLSKSWPNWTGSKTLLNFMKQSWKFIRCYLIL